MGEPEPAVLGQLLILQASLQAMGDEEKLAEFLCAGLKRIPGVEACGLCLSGRMAAAVPPGWFEPWQSPDCRVGRELRPDSGEEQPCCLARAGTEFHFIDIRTIYHRYGALVSKVSDPEQYHTYLPFLENTANQVALLLETRAQERELRKNQHELGQQVEERTTELAKANEALRASEHFVRRIVETAPTLIYIFDLESQRKIYCNDTIGRMLGYSKKEIHSMGDRFFELIYHSGDLGVIALHHEAMRCAGDGDVREVEYRARHASGEWRVLHSWETVFARDGNGVPNQTAGVAIDVTAQRENEIVRLRLEEQLRQTQKMEAIGQLAGGVAHDFNNLLTVIMGNVELATRTVETLVSPGCTPLGEMAEIQRSTERAAELTRQLLAFSHRQVSRPRLLDLGQSLRETEKMLRRLLTENITLEVAHAGSLPAVYIDPGQLEQVVMNLVVNARDAMPQGGALTLETKSTFLPEGASNRPGQGGGGQYVMLSVSDTGIGMSPQTQEHIFEPFFTTKPVGTGTGLGLSTVYGIVQQAGGHVTVSSAPGQGTSVRVYLPARLNAALDEPPPALPVENHHGTETIVICEDDVKVLALMAAYLRTAGYVVLAVPAANEALDLVTRHGPRVRLLITDVIMPDMDGSKLARAARAVSPQLRTLYVSGYPAEVIAQYGVLPNGVDFLEKPFTEQEFLRRVRLLLENPAKEDSLLA